MFRAEADGKSLQFDTIGLVGGNEIFKDRETGSVWQQSTREATSGPLKGTQLKPYPFLLTTWGEWRRQHPQTLVLKPLPGYAERLAAKNQLIDQGLFGMGPAPAGSFSRDHRLPPRVIIFGLEIGDESVAFPLPTLRRLRVVNDEISGQPLLIVHQPASDTTTAFVAKYQGRTLRFKAADAQATGLTDLETHSRWNAYGRCISGPLKGAHLPSLILEPEFWFAWSEFHPHTELYVDQAGRRSGNGATRSR